MEKILNTYISCKAQGVMAELIKDTDTGAFKIAVSNNGSVSYEDKFLDHYGNMWIPPRGIEYFPEGISLSSRVSDYKDADTLAREISEFINRYVDMDEAFRAVCTHYVMLTYLAPAFYSLPYLRVIGEPSSGKSTLTGALGSLSYRGFEVSGAVTVPVIFRTIDMFGVTLTIDESDFANESDASDLIKILNSGYNKNRPVTRLERVDGKYVPVTYKVFGPKILNGRDRFNNLALESRCITYRMHESNARPISYQLPEEYSQQAAVLRDKLLKYRFDYFKSVTTITLDWDANFPSGFPPRLRQLLIPLLSIPGDAEMRVKIKEYFVLMGETAKIYKAHSLEGRILYVIKNILHRKHMSRDLSVSGICDDVQEKMGREGIYLTPKKVGLVIHDLGLKTVRSTGGYYFLVPDETQLRKLYEEYDLS